MEKFYLRNQKLKNVIDPEKQKILNKASLIHTVLNSALTATVIGLALATITFYSETVGSDF